VGDAGEADGGQGERCRYGPAQQRGGEVDLGHVPQHPRGELHAAPGGGVGRHRDLVLGGAVDVVEHPAGEPLAGDCPEVVDVRAAGEPALHPAAPHRPEPQHGAQGVEHAATVVSDAGGTLLACVDQRL
jgi:hypothetical protein